MKLQVMQFTCEHNHTFDNFGLPEDSYAEFLLRSGIETRYLNAFDDATYEEAATLLERHPITTGLKENQRLNLLQTIYGPLTCDPAPDGTYFALCAHPACPYCGTNSMRSWDYKRPPEQVEQALPPVSHLRWRALEDHEKQQLLDQLLVGGLAELVV